MSLFGRKKRSASPFCSVVVAAAGSSTRMEGQDKMFAELDGVPVLARTLIVLDACRMIHEIVVVTRPEMISRVAQLCRDHQIKKASKVIVGGETRTRSVFNGVNACSQAAETIAIHDGARPLVTSRVLEDALQKGAQTGAAAPAVPVKDTVKEAEHGLVIGTPERSRLFAVQTPQVFEASLIKAALLKAIEDKAVLTDDCSAAERMGMKISLTEGSYENIKITTPVDLLLGEAILKGRRGL